MVRGGLVINLEKFTQEKEAIVPITDGQFQYQRKRYYKRNNVSGWHQVRINGNTYEVISPVYLEAETVAFKTIKGYTYHNNIIFQNFDVAKRKLNAEVMKPLHFNNVETFSSIEAIAWEDSDLYYYKPNYSDSKIFELKQKYDMNESFDGLKGITPELKTLFLFHEIEKQKIKEEQDKIRLAKELEEYKKTLQGRLLLTFGRVGAKVLKYSVSGKRITVDWSLDSIGQQFNSVIDYDSFRIIEAGYCMSGSDRDHSVTSMVELAKDYDEDNLIHKTRY